MEIRSRWYVFKILSSEVMATLDENQTRVVRSAIKSDDLPKTRKTD